MLLSPLNKISPLSPKRSGVGSTFRLYTNSTSENNIRIRTKDGSPTMINWGDGVVEMLPHNVYVTHNYSPNYSGNVIIYNKDNISAIAITKGSWDIDLKDLPRGMNDSLFLQTGTNTIIKGDISDIPPNLINFNITTNGIVFGDLSNLSINITSGFYLLGDNHKVTYTAGRVWQNISTALWIRPAVGVFTTTMVDNLLIDLDNSPLFTGAGTVDLRGNCGAASSASSAAIASLQSKGKTVNVN